MNFYVNDNDKPKKVTPGAFYAMLEKEITPLKTDFNVNSIASVVQFVLKKEDTEIEGDARQAEDIIRKAVETSVELEKAVAGEKDKKAKDKAAAAKKKAEEAKKAEALAAEEAKVVQAALVDSGKYALDFRKDTELSISSRIAEAVGTNFDLTKNGGLVLKKGAKLEAKDAFTAIQGMVALSEAGNTMKSKSALALADVLGTVDKIHGEDFYNQLMDDGNKSLMSAAKMVASHFPAEEREKIDPKGNLGFAHWQELAGKKGFTPAQRQKLAKFAAKSGASRDPLRNLIKSVSELKDEEKDDVIAAIGKVTSVEAATELVAKYNVNSGNGTGEKVTHLYLTIVDKRTLSVQSSNDWNEEMARASHGVVVLGSKPKFTLDNLALDEIKFVHTAPEVLPAGTGEEEEQEAYASLRVFEKEGKIMVVGTIDGIAQDVEAEGASTVEEGIAKVKETFGLNEENVDGDGNLWDIHE